MSEQKVINFSVFVSIVSREIKFIFIFDNVSHKKNTQKKTEKDGGGGDRHKFTLLILIYIIYFEEFIMNLIRFEALMPFLWTL